ncbi:hypothetical protein [Rhizobium sp. RU36D]|uniref:hypothetical protein n=1 Tax=Rhizobium sp. RU36D TaxID=1907415 RepID=UPI0009D7D87F|nr:hypothetical protein [Rhizobium sp. RU36D]SMD19585.1 hypothetical protein SAMN05880593_14213 [Rhizobium sp. RU36D]
MLTKSKLLLLDSDERAFLLVGAYIGHFALLEMGINNAIKTVLNLNTAASLIVTRNMTFDEKIKNLRALVQFFIYDKEKAKKFDKLAKEARNISELRNIIAHTPFYGSQTTDGVRFFVTKASSSLEIENLDWSIDEFIERIDHVRQTDNGLREIEKSMSLQRIAEALSERDIPPFGGLLALGATMLADQAESLLDPPLTLSKEDEE